MKVNKEIYLDFILSELEKGTDRKSILSMFGTKWPISDRTFNRYWKDANSVFSERQAKRQELREATLLEGEEEQLRLGILTKRQRMQIASNIATGQEFRLGKEKTWPALKDRIKALDYLSKIDGDYAAVKADITSKGEKIEDTRPMVELPDGTIIHI